MWTNGWTDVDLTKQTNAPLAAGNPGGYAFNAQATEHVVYRDINGHIQELQGANGQWVDNDLTKQTGAPLAAGDPVAFMFNAQGTQHVFYRTLNGDIQELWWLNVWYTDDVIRQTCAPDDPRSCAPPAAGDPAGYVFDAQGTQHVFYCDINGDVQELWWMNQ